MSERLVIGHMWLFEWVGEESGWDCWVEVIHNRADSAPVSSLLLPNYSTNPDKQAIYRCLLQTEQQWQRRVSSGWLLRRPGNHPIMENTFTLCHIQVTELDFLYQTFLLRFVVWDIYQILHCFQVRQFPVQGTIKVIVNEKGILLPFLLG